MDNGAITKPPPQRWRLSKRWRLVGVLALAGLILLSVFLVKVWQAKKAVDPNYVPVTLIPAVPLQSQKGTVAVISDTEIVLNTDTGELTLIITPDTQYFKDYTIENIDKSQVKAGSNVDVTYNYENNQATSVWYLGQP